MVNKNKLIIKVNSLLIDYFGIPPRAANLPNPLDLLIATILSQNTTDTNSYRAFKNLKESFPKWEGILNARRSTIEELIKICGLAGQKASAIKNLISELGRRGDISLDYISKLENEKAIEELTSYEGVGVKTASCVLLFALNRNICPVDTHVHRTTNRIGIVKTSLPNKTFFELNRDFPAGIAHSFHTNLIRLGREICKSQNPRCSLCPLVKICRFDKKNFGANSLSGKRDFMLLDNV